jgi:hypothetical protein
MPDVFDMFHVFPKKMKVENREQNSRLLLNVPNQFPQSFYDMLEQLLVYSSKKRGTARKIVDCEFAV